MFWLGSEGEIADATALPAGTALEKRRNAYVDARYQEGTRLARS